MFDGRRTNAAYPKWFIRDYPRPSVSLWYFSGGDAGAIMCPFPGPTYQAMRYSLLLFFIMCTISLEAQDCFYQLRLQDSGGDGLNGGRVTVIVGTDDPRSYTLDATNDDGSRGNFFFPVTDGASVSVAYLAGAFPEEASFSILDNNDSLVYSVTAPVTNLTLNAFTANCRTCAPPPASSIELYRLRYNSVDLRFRSVAPAADPTYLIEYGPDGFDPASGDGITITTQDTMLRIGGLSATTRYSFYVSTICQSPLDTTVRRGPFRIMTQPQKDVGVTVLSSPTDGCSPTAGEVTIGITNFGGEAQQFFKVDFLVNGALSGVSTPFDGIFTGVVGVDSTEFFTFDTKAQLGLPGVYRIDVFTLLEGDENSSNDTFSTTVLSVPVITEYPYAQDFETNAGFWRGERGGDGPSSWQRGRPTGMIIDRAASGDFAFVTNPRGIYNNRERSFLRSPCFDFSGLTSDPFLSFKLFVDTEVNFDRVYLQASTDDGKSWRTLERNPTSINWYNNGRDQAWDGSGGLGENYALVGQQLSGLAGQARVQLRFVFESDDDGQRDGVAIDDIRIAPPADFDLAAVSARVFGGESCGSLDSLLFTFADIGRQRADSTTVSFRVGDGETVSTKFAAPSTRGDRRTVLLNNPSIDITPGDSVLIEAWVTTVGDTSTHNDTIVVVFRPISTVPFLVDFEDGRTPRNWELSDDLVIGQRAGNASVTLYDRLNAGDSIAEFATGFYGRLETGDSIMLDITLTPTVAGTPLTAYLLPSYSYACDDAVELDDTIILVEGLNSISIPVSDDFTRFAYSVIWQSGEFFVDFDNIRIKRCPPNLGLKLTTVAPSGIFADDGRAFIEPGLGTGPYTYRWSNGDVTQSTDSLSVANYTVTVTDALGCSDSRTVVVDLEATATGDPNGLLSGMQVFPNPTSGRVEVSVKLPVALPLTLEVYDARGRRIELRELGTADAISTGVELGRQPAGLYFLRLRAGTSTRTVRVVRN